MHAEGDSPILLSILLLLLGTYLSTTWMRIYLGSRYAIIHLLAYYGIQFQRAVKRRKEKSFLSADSNYWLIKGVWRHTTVYNAVVMYSVVLKLLYGSSNIAYTVGFFQLLPEEKMCLYQSISHHTSKILNVAITQT